MFIASCFFFIGGFTLPSMSPAPLRCVKWLVNLAWIVVLATWTIHGLPVMTRRRVGLKKMGDTLW